MMRESLAKAVLRYRVSFLMRKVSLSTKYMYECENKNRAN